MILDFLFSSVIWFRTRLSARASSYIKMRVAQLRSWRSLVYLSLYLLYNTTKAVASSTSTNISGGIIDRKPPPPSLAEIPNHLVLNMPAPNKSIFFTGQNSIGTHAIKAWAATVGLDSIGVVWTTGNDFLNPDNYEGTSETLKQFCIDFSRVYAIQTSGTAYLIISKGVEPTPTSIFYRTELEILMHSGRVDRIIRLDLNSDFTGPANLTSIDNIYWEKGNPKPPAMESDKRKSIAHI
jgi:hypothetical protein